MGKLHKIGQEEWLGSQVRIQGYFPPSPSLGGNFSNQWVLPVSISQNKSIWYLSRPKWGNVDSYGFCLIVGSYFSLWKLSASDHHLLSYLGYHPCDVYTREMSKHKHTTPGTKDRN